MFQPRWARTGVGSEGICTPLVQPVMWREAAGDREGGEGGREGGEGGREGGREGERERERLVRMKNCIQV